MAFFALGENFNGFFGKINPGASFVAQASSEHTTVTGLIEDRNGLAAELSPSCFLQGSYRQDTAIYAINDVDIVVVCRLWYPPSDGGSARGYGRDEIFRIIAAPLLNDRRYSSKVRFGPTSMCIKVDLGIKLEILPVVFKAGNYDPSLEPFVLYRPSSQKWEDGYARQHQRWLTYKNQNSGFIPSIKVLKHLRSRARLDAVSFHLECLLFNLSDAVFKNGPADYIPAFLRAIANVSAAGWYMKRVLTPCGERDIFSTQEWRMESWGRFHAAVVGWSRLADIAAATPDRNRAIAAWKALLGDDYFPW